MGGCGRAIGCGRRMGVGLDALRLARRPTGLARGRVSLVDIFLSFCVCVCSLSCVPASLDVSLRLRFKWLSWLSLSRSALRRIQTALSVSPCLCLPAFCISLRLSLYLCCLCLLYISGMSLCLFFSATRKPKAESSGFCRFRSRGAVGITWDLRQWGFESDCCCLFLCRFIFLFLCLCLSVSCMSFVLVNRPNRHACTFFALSVLPLYWSGYNHLSLKPPCSTSLSAA